MRGVIRLWLAVAWVGFAVLPWSAIGGGGFFAFQWLRQYPWESAAAPALVQLFGHGRLWFVPLFLVLLAPTPLLWLPDHATVKLTPLNGLRIVTVLVGAVASTMVVVSAAVGSGCWFPALSVATLKKP